MMESIAVKPQTSGVIILMVLWAAAIALSPVHLLPPGSPQLSHAVLAAFLVLSLTTYFAPFRYDAVLILFTGLWLADIFIVNAIWWQLDRGQDNGFLLATIYYGFNASIMLATASLLSVSGERGVRLAKIALLAAMTAQALTVLVESGGVRATGTFPNPNKLGYWMLLATACWLALKSTREPMNISDVGVLALTCTLCAASGSRAALLGAAIITLIAVLCHRPRGVMLGSLLILALSGTMVIAVTAEYWWATLVDHTMVDRFNQERKHDSFAGRGYDRLWLWPEYLLLGAGEGNYSRFAMQSLGGGLEMHSTLGNVLFSYGILGVVLLASTVLRVFSSAGFRYAALTTPFLLYGMAHNGGRETLLWVFLGIVASVRLTTQTEENTDE